MSQVHLEQVSSWEGAKAAPERFVNDSKAQPHWAHRKRDENRLSPAEVLGGVTNRLRTPEQLHRIFYAMRFLRRLNRWAMSISVAGNSLEKKRLLASLR